MRIPIRRKGNRSPVASLVSRPAPVKGWNAKDPLADMKPECAIELENFFPLASSVMLRKGFSEHVTGITGQVESIMPYNTPAGTQTLFAAAGTEFYDVTTAGAVGAAVVSGMTNARWQHLNYTNSSGDSYLCCFNGTDAPQYWDGSSWIAITGVSTPAITGVTATGLISAATHKRRMWLVEKDTLKAWYLPADAVGGAANALDLTGIAKRGGYLMAVDTWTLDAGEGLDDYWVGVTSEGEVIVYQGTDPSSSNTWSLKGVWHLGEPIGRRCLQKYAGDLLLILTNGVFPLSKTLITEKTNPTVALTDAISPAMNTAAQSYKANYGWCLAYHPVATMLLLNVPVAEGSSQQQYVMNTLTGAWSKFTGWEGNCIAVFNEELYMGCNGKVIKVWDTFSDNSTNITGTAKTAFDYFGKRVKKSFKMARPVFETNGSPTIRIGLNVDFDNGDMYGTLNYTSTTASRWGIALWGIGLWASGLQALRNWLGLTGLGICAATRLKTASQGVELRWLSTDYLFETGGYI